MTVPLQACLPDLDIDLDAYPFCTEESDWLVTVELDEDEAHIVWVERANKNRDLSSRSPERWSDPHYLGDGPWGA